MEPEVLAGVVAGPDRRDGDCEVQRGEGDPALVVVQADPEQRARGELPGLHERDQGLVALQLGRR